MHLKKIPFWLWPNTLSLDAPVVAVAWVWMLKDALGIRFFELSALWVMFGAVWCIYALDRILDVYKNAHLADQTYRHAFSWKFRWPLMIMILVTTSICVSQTLYFLPAAMLSAGIAVIFLVFLYFLAMILDDQKNTFVRYLPHSIFALLIGLFIFDNGYPGITATFGPDFAFMIAAVLSVVLGLMVLRLCIFFKTDEIPYGKNLAAGFIFAIGVAIPASLYQTNSAELLVDVFFPLVDQEKNPLWRFFDTLYNSSVAVGNHLIRVVGTVETVCFAILCMLNITAIDLWQSARQSENEEVKANNEMVLTMGLMALVIFCILYIFVAQYPAKSYFYAIMVACGILHAINRIRSHFTLDGQRVLADLALVAPVPFYFLFNSAS